MAKYRVWNPYESPKTHDSFEKALGVAEFWILEHKGKVQNNVTITREDLRRSIIVCFIRGKHIE